MENQFISMAYKQHNVMPLTKSLNYAIYTIPVAIQERVIKLADQFSFKHTLTNDRLLIKFN